MSEFPLLESAASGMEAQRSALDVAARNVAAAEAAGPRGSYLREVPAFRVDGEGDETRVAFVGTHTERGVNVDVVQEMLSVMNASRAYDADASLFDVGKRLASATIDLERLP